jgi:hypothetical protein
VTEITPILIYYTEFEFYLIPSLKNITSLGDDR